MSLNFIIVKLTLRPLWERCRHESSRLVFLPHTRHLGARARYLEYLPSRLCSSGWQESACEVCNPFFMQKFFVKDIWDPTRPYLLIYFKKKNCMIGNVFSHYHLNFVEVLHTFSCQIETRPIRQTHYWS